MENDGNEVEIPGDEVVTDHIPEDELVTKHIPEEVVTKHILPWLPIKPLIQYKLVSKNWNGIISSPSFILKHTNQPLKHHPDLPVESLIIQYDFKFYILSYNPETPENTDLVQLKVDFGDKYLMMVGSDKGLVCVADNRGELFCLYNPATNEINKFYSGLKHTNQRCLWGFGYVSAENDFKVVRILYVSEDDDQEEIDQEIKNVDVYSLRSNLWKNVDIGVWFEEGMEMYPTPTLVNETVYWRLDNYQDEMVKINELIDRLVGFSKTGKIFLSHIQREGTGGKGIAIISLLGQGERQTLVTLGPEIWTFMVKYVPSEISPHPSAQWPNAPAAAPPAPAPAPAPAAEHYAL
ncbi:putative F-box protein At3g16210 [Spinacia oleracea]|uniref:F-box protein At3g16210 n=1 Tax=Spinacia oleracea TaxID=3562 RepID=A0A9R0J0E4_SPIOL|nr:putative F-box protein At3g16210 [Spinacia oleracea]